jgi:hypothetical protein
MALLSLVTFELVCATARTVAASLSSRSMRSGFIGRTNYSQGWLNTGLFERARTGTPAGSRSEAEVILEIDPPGPPGERIPP